MTTILEINKIYNKECLEGMREIGDKSIDMILCDLPYGTTQNKWDSVIDLKQLWLIYERVIKDNGAIVLTAQTPFDKILGSSNLRMLRYEWIWEKDNGTGFLNANKMPLKNHENILVFYKKQPTYIPIMRTGFQPYVTERGHTGSNYGVSRDAITVSDGERFPLSILEFKRDKEKLHPTQKPVALFEYLIKTYTKKGDLVLDNCMGSGTTAVAAINTDRNFIGFELNKDYFEMANKRIEQNTTQLDLFEVN